MDKTEDKSPRHQTWLVSSPSLNDGGFRSKGIGPNGGFNDLTVLPKPGIMVFGEIIPMADPTIQVSEL